MEEAKSLQNYEVNSGRILKTSLDLKLKKCHLFLQEYEYSTHPQYSNVAMIL